MITTVIFDMDGTLVQTEILKARSYGLALQELTSGKHSIEDGTNAFLDVVGKPRMEVASYIIEKFRIMDAARQLMHRYDVKTPWQGFVQLRLEHYNALLSDRKTITDAICPNNMNLFRHAQKKMEYVAIATMSRCHVATKFVEILGLTEEIDFLASADDVEHGKPDPEIYLLVARQVNVASNECLVVEDSASGVAAALNANMHCLAATSEFTVDGVRKLANMKDEYIVEDPAQLVAVFETILQEISSEESAPNQPET